MTYFVMREGREVGPFRLSELKAAVERRRVSPEDSVRDASGGHWENVAALLREKASKLPPPPPAPSSTDVAAGVAPPEPPRPPGLSWIAVLALGVLTCGTFTAVWALRQAAYARRLEPASEAFGLYLLSVAASAAAQVTALETAEPSPLGAVFLLASLLLFVFGTSQIQAVLEERLGLRLSSVMSVLFSVLYFQYRLDRLPTERRGNERPS